MAVKAFPIYEPQGNGNLNTDNDPAVTDFKAMNNNLANAFGGPDMAAGGTALGSLAGPAGAVAGNLAGTTLSYFLGNQQAKNQMRNQKKLMQEQHKLQMEQQFMAPQLQKLGMEAAGMNPADGSYTQATPQVPGASAPMPQMANMSNIFDGLTEMITALKAPTEIEKMVADTELAKAKTGETEASTGKIGEETKKLQLLTPKEYEKLDKETQQLTENIRNAKNMNDIIEAENNFLKEQSAAIFTNFIGILEADGTWENLPENTKIALTDLANGDLKLGIGEYEAFMKSLNAIKGLSDNNKEILENSVKSVVAYKQLTDGKTTDAIAKLPETTRNKLLTEMKEINQRIQNLKASKTGLDIENWQKIIHDPNYMLSAGLIDELKIYAGVEGAKDIREHLNNIIRQWEERLINGKKTPKTPKTKNNYSGPTTHGGTRIPTFGKK